MGNNVRSSTQLCKHGRSRMGNPSLDYFWNMNELYHQE